MEVARATTTEEWLEGIPPVVQKRVWRRFLGPPVRDLMTSISPLIIWATNQPKKLERKIGFVTQVCQLFRYNLLRPLGIFSVFLVRLSRHWAVGDISLTAGNRPENRS
jgi:hypothetical protein